MKLLLPLFVLLPLFTQASTPAVPNGDCKPTKETTTKDGDPIYFYGGTIRNQFSKPYTVLELYACQVSDGEKGTFIVVNCDESVEEPRDYEFAVSSFLNQTALNKSSLSLVVNGQNLNFDKPLHCTHTTRKFLGKVQGYTITFMANISKEQVQLLQDYDIENFNFNCGGKPYDKRFKGANGRTKAIKEAIGCIDLESIFDVVPKKSSDLDMTPVDEIDYSKHIVGKWTTTIDGSTIVMELDPSNITLYNMGIKSESGTYQIIKERFIYSTDKQSGMSTIDLFLKDMIVLIDNGKEVTWTRIE